MSVNIKTHIVPPLDIVWWTWYCITYGKLNMNWLYHPLIKKIKENHISSGYISTKENILKVFSLAIIKMM